MPRSIPLPEADPTAIGIVSEPPFARLPDPAALFATRAVRFRHLAQEGELGPYLAFLASVAEAQDAAERAAHRPEPVPSERLERAATHGMPPLDRAGFRRDEVLDRTLTAFAEALGAGEMPPEAAAALERLRRPDPGQLDAVIADVLNDAAPVDGVADHVLVAAGLQVHFARLASSLQVKKLQPIGETLCPACGGPPVASVVVGWVGMENTRFCACPLCATSWHFVRVRCTACGSTKGVGLEGIEGGPESVKAETCSECGCYAKILYQTRDAAVEPVADDVASLGLDLLMRDGPFRRASYNPYLIGY